MPDVQEPAPEDDMSLWTLVGRMIAVSAATAALGVLLYFERTALAPFFDRAFGALAEWTGEISAAGIIGGGSGGVGALLIWAVWKFVNSLDDPTALETFFKSGRQAFFSRAAAMLVAAAVGGFLLLNTALWLGILVDSDADYKETPQLKFYGIALLTGTVVFVARLPDGRPTAQFYVTIGMVVFLTFYVLGYWTYIIPAENDHGYLMWAVFFGVAGWLIHHAWKNDPQAHLHNYYASRVFAWCVMVVSGLLLITGNLPLDSFTFGIIAFAWIWANRAIHPRSTFFGLPFLRRRQSRAFAWLRRVNPFRSAPLRSAPAGDGEAASADGRPFHDG